jgi:hypothetical protein
MAKVVKLNNSEWTLGKRIGDPSGFGQVYEAVGGDGAVGVVKLVPKEPGADRELLFEDLAGIPNVVPVIDSGESGKYWALAMPRADRSLRKHLTAVDGRVDPGELVSVLTDIAVALAALDGRVVHRDLKPENVLLLGGRWSLADFGIARYAEASTAPDTRKMAMSPPYAAPERWRYERATSAADVYSLGVIAWEVAMGRRPFNGPSWDDFRDQHLHENAPPVTGVPTSVASLIDECLYKAAEARPTPKNLLARLERASQPASAAASLLQAANRAVVAEQAEAMAERSAASTEAERRTALFQTAARSLQAISNRLHEAIIEHAPATEPDPASPADDWALRLGPGSLGMDPAKKAARGNFGHWAPAFDVVAFATIGINIPEDRYGYRGRHHSLWYCDAEERGLYRWYEMGFMTNALLGQQFAYFPVAFDPSESAGKAFAGGMNEYQLARPIMPIDQGEEEAFINRWLEWFAQAASGQLRRPSSTPEAVEGARSYRGR